jgi:hypothetical protein
MDRSSSRQLRHEWRREHDVAEERSLDDERELHDDRWWIRRGDARSASDA